MSKWKSKITYWSQLLLLPIYGLSFLTPRNKKIWLFGSTFGRRFADNPKYLYLYTAQQEKDLRPIWISHNKAVVQYLKEQGYEAYYAKSLKGIWYCLHAGYYIFDNYSKDISFWLSGGAIKMNLWHGVGNKCINHDNIHDKFRHPKNAWERFTTFPRRLSDEKPSHYVLATSPVKAKIFASAFAVSPDHVIMDGLPRDDVLFEDCTVQNLLTPKEKELKEKLNQIIKNGGKILAYMPTFRDTESMFFDVMDMDKMNDYLRENNYYFLSKLHPKSKLQKEFSNISYSNVIVGAAEIDPYTFLKEVDVLITDYSSIYTDYMLLNRPVVAFHYDYKEYSEDTRSAYFDFNEYMPEKRAVNMEELQQTIKSVLQEDTCIEKRMISRNRMFAYAEGNACVRLVNKIKNINRKKSK